MVEYLKQGKATRSVAYNNIWHDLIKECAEERGVPPSKLKTPSRRSIRRYEKKLKIAHCYVEATAEERAEANSDLR